MPSPTSSLLTGQWLEFHQLADYHASRTAYQALLAQHKLVCSMSKKGDGYDNAAMESWNHSFKVEAVHGERFATRAEAKQHTFEYIEVYFNRKRLHSKLGYLSPEAFELKHVA